MSSAKVCPHRLIPYIVCIALDIILCSKSVPTSGFVDVLGQKQRRANLLSKFRVLSTPPSHYFIGLRAEIQVRVACQMMKNHYICLAWWRLILKQGCLVSPIAWSQLNTILSAAWLDQNPYSSQGFPIVLDSQSKQKRIIIVLRLSPSFTLRLVFTFSIYSCPTHYFRWSILA